MSPMTRGSMPRPSDRAKAAFTDLLPEDDAVVTKPMFGNLSAFVNGNMFAGLFGEDLFVRLPDAEAATIKRQGGRPFEPVTGRAMTGYVMVPATWQRKPESVQAWVTRALTLTRAMPAKAKKKPATKKPTRAKAKP